MTDKKDPNKKHYFQEIDPEVFTKSILARCQTENASPLTIWEQGQTEDSAEHFIAIDYDAHSKVIKLKATGNFVTKIAGSQKVGKQVLVKVPFDETIHFFTGGSFKFHPETLTYSLEIQQDIFKSQKRSHFRLTASEVIPIQFKIDEQVFQALDISIGGTSFEIEKSDSERFAKGKTFKDCTLRFDRKNYYIPEAKVTAQLPLKEDNGENKGRLKVGILFINLSKKIEEELYIKISTEARGEEMKKKFDSILAKKSQES